MDNVPDGQSILAGLGHQRFGLGHDPGFVWMFGSWGNEGPPRVDMQKGNHKYFADTPQGQDLLAEEVHFPQRRGVALEEIVPGSPLPQRRRWQAGRPQYVLDRRLR